MRQVASDFRAAAISLAVTVELNLARGRDSPIPSISDISW
jgi:hypothetical protein